MTTHKNFRSVAAGRISNPRTRLNNMGWFSFVGYVATLVLFVGNIYAQPYASWPIYRADAGLSGRAKAEGPAIPDLFWVKNIGLEKIESPVVNAEGVIIFTSRGDKYVYALNRDGSEQWRFSHKLPNGTNETFSNPPTLGSDGTIYVGTEEGGFFAINSNGSLKWRVTVGGYVGLAPNIDQNGNIYLACDDAQLYVFDPAGNLLCVGSLDGLKPGNTPAIVSNSQIYVPAGNSIFVFNASCARVARWNFPVLEEVAWVAGNSNGSTLYIGSRIKPIVLAIDAQTGKQIWSYSYDARFGRPSQPALGPDGSIYFAGFDAGLLVALNLDGKEKWTHDQGSARYKTMPVVDASGDIYIVNESLGLAAFAPDKTLLWNLPNVQCKYAPAFGPDGTLYVPSLKKLYAVRPQPPFAASLELVDGSGQTGCTDSTLANLIQARVRDQYGHGFEGQQVRFRAIVGGGQPIDTTVNTLADGIASIEWRLGAKLGEQQLEVSSSHNGQPLSGSPDTVFAQAVGPKIDGKSLVIFNTTAVKDSSDTTYTIFNRSDCILTIERLEISGSTAFSEIPPFVNNTLIPPQDSLVVRLRFAPRDSGTNEATLKIHSNDNTKNPLLVALRGEAFTRPQIDINPLNLNFGAVKVGDDSMQTIKISNLGTAALIVSALTFSDAAYSTPTPTPTPIEILPDSSKLVPIFFEPTAAQQYPATLKVESNDKTNNPVIVTLGGRGTIAPDIHASPNPLILVACNDSTATDTVTIFNLGNATLVISSLVSDNPAFSFDGSGFSLLPKGSKKIPVTFSPKAVKSDSAVMIIASNDPDEDPLRVRLLGEVKGPEIRLFAKQSSFALCQNEIATFEICIVNPSDCVLRIDSIRSSTIFSQNLGSFGKLGQEIEAATKFPIFIGPRDTLCLLPQEIVGAPIDFKVRVRVRSNGIPDPTILEIPVIIKPPVIAAVDTVDFGDVMVGDTKQDSAKVWSLQCQVRIDSVRITGLDAFAFHLAEPKRTFPVVLAEGQVIYIPVAFNPKDIDEHTALLEIFSNDPQHGVTNPKRVVLIGNGILKQPDIDVVPTSITLGPLCSDSLQAAVTVSNVGDDTLRVSKLEFSNPAFLTTHKSNFNLAPKQSTTITVIYTPTGASVDTGTLSIYSNDPDSSEKVVVVNLRGESRPEIEAKPIAINFGALCASDSQSVIVFNRGRQPLQVTDLVFSNAAFSTAHTASFTIASCDSETVWVRFSPTTGDSAFGTLTIHSNDADEPLVSVQLTGKGGVPDIGGKKQVSFEPVHVQICNGKDNADSLTYHIKNEGDCLLEITELSVNAPFSIIAPATPFEIAANDSVPITLIFTPQDGGSFTGTLRIASNDPDENPFEVTLEGVGISKPSIVVLPPILDFGVLCADSSLRLVTIANPGQDTLHVSNLVFSNPSVFSTTHPTRFSVAPCDSEKVWVRFLYAQGTFNETLTIHSDDAARPTVVVPLKAEGGVPDIAGAPEIVFDTVEVQICAGKNNADTLQYVLRNDGKCDLSITALRTSLPFAVISPVTPQIIPANGELVLTLSFTPQADSTSVGTLLVESNDADEDSFTVVLRGEGTAQPDIDVTPLALNFGNVKKDSTKCLPLAIHNYGELELIISSFKFSNPVFSTQTMSFSLKCDGDSVLSICFMPKDTIEYSGTLTIASNDPDENPVVVILNGKGLPPPPPDIEVSPLAYDFGEDCSLDSTIIEVRNVGEGLLKVTKLEFTNPNPAVFWTSQTVPFEVAADDTQEVKVFFNPTFAQIDSSDLLIHSNDPDEPVVVVKLKGAGGAPDIAGEGAVTFAPVKVQTCSGMDNKGAFVYKISNTGTCTLTVKSFSVNPPFSVATPAPITIPPFGGSSDIVLVFEPKENRTYTETLRIFSDDPDENPFEVVLTGDGIFAPDIKVTPLTLNFGDVQVGKSDSLTITIANNGKFALLINSFVFSDSDFTSPTKPPFSLVCSKDSIVTIIFRPSRNGPYDDTLTIGSNDPNRSTVVVRLLANGVSGGLVAQPNPFLFPDVCLGDDKELCLTVTNASNSGMAVVKWTVAPGDGIFRLDSPVDEFFLGVGEQNSTKICVNFAPKDTLEYRGTLTIYYLLGFNKNDNQDTLATSIELIGHGVSPHISGKKLLVFSNIGVNADTTLPYTVFNNTMCELRIDSLTITGKDSIDFSVIGSNIPPSTTIAGGGSLEIDVQFAPKTVGLDKTAQLNIWSNDKRVNPFVVQLQGDAPTGTLFVSPDLNFGPVCVTLDTTLSFVLENRGSSPIEIKAITLNRDEQAFTVKSIPEAPFMLDPDSTASVQVTFEPMDIRDFQTGVVFSASLGDGALLEVKRFASGSGKKFSPELGPLPPKLVFEEIALKQSTEQMLTITNNGCDVLSIHELKLKREGVYFGFVDKTWPRKLAPGEGFNVTVWFEGKDFGDFTDSLSIFNDDPIMQAQPKVLPVEGRVGSGSICFFTDADSGKLDFGRIPAKTNKTLKLKLINCTPDTGIQTAVVDVTIRPLKISQFKFDPQTLPQFLIGGEALVDVVFSPEVQGIFKDELWFDIRSAYPPIQTKSIKVDLIGVATEQGDEVVVKSNVVTPNGDEYNEETLIAFPQEKYPDAVLHIFDLRGLRVRVYRQATAPNEFAWNGTDENGGYVLPGPYLWILESRGKRVASGRFAVIR